MNLKVYTETFVSSCAHQLQQQSLAMKFYCVQLQPKYHKYEGAKLSKRVKR